MSGTTNTQRNVFTNFFLLFGPSACTAAFVFGVLPPTAEAFAPHAPESEICGLNNAGRALLTTRKFTEAAAKFQEALNACVDCTELPVILNNLGAAYSANSQYAAAIQAYQRALSRYEQRDGQNARALLEPLNGLTIAYREAGSYPLARQTAERAAAIAVERGVTETLEGAAVYANLGAVLSFGGETAEARKWLERALVTRQKLVGENHVLVAETLNNLAQVYQQAGLQKQAADTTRKAVAILESAPGPIPPALPSALFNNYGRILLRGGHAKEAEDRFRQAIAAAEQNFGPEHPEVAVGLTNLVYLLGTRHKYKEAEALAARAEAIDRRAFPEGNQRLAHVLSAAGTLAFDRKDYKHAELRFNEAKAILTRCFPAGHAEIGRMSANLAEVYWRENRMAEAEQNFRQAIEFLEPAVGPLSPELLSTLQHYAQVLRFQQKYAEAALIEARAMKIHVSQVLRRNG